MAGGERPPLRPVFHKVNCWGDVELAALHPDAVRQILRRRAAQAGLTVSGLERLSPHALRRLAATAPTQPGPIDPPLEFSTPPMDCYEP